MRGKLGIYRPPETSLRYGRVVYAAFFETGASLNQRGKPPFLTWEE
jgi:hypothetical protein